MLVEHSFITTLEAIDAMRLASEFLASRGFAVETTNAFALDSGGWNSLEVRRGKLTGKARTKTVLDFPQVVRLEWDRGRIDMAALSLFAPGVNAGLARSSRVNPFEADQRQLLFSIARSMELAVGGQRPDQGSAEWGRAEQELLAQASAKRKKGSGTLLIVVAILGAAAIAAVIIAVVFGAR